MDRTTTAFQGSEADPMLDFLRSVTECRLEIKRLKSRVAELDSQSKKSTPSPGGTPGGGGDTHGHESLWAALADARDRAEQVAVKREEQIKAVEVFISKIPDTRHRTILRLKYLKGLNWTRMQFALREEGVYYSDRHLRRMHGKALASARTVWDGLPEEERQWR